MLRAQRQCTVVFAVRVHSCVRCGCWFIGWVLSRHNTHAPECRKLSVVSWLLPAEENTKLQANALVVLSRTLLGEGGRSARAVGKPTECMAVMAGLSSVPLWRWLRPRVEDERRTVPTSREEREGFFGFGHFCT